MKKPLSTQSTATRERILDTARTLLRRHGGQKLTVVDIARTLDMSHANVYRFFRSKAEILDAIVDEWMAKLAAFVESIERRPQPAAARLEALVVELHRLRHQKCVEDPEIYETYRRVMELRPDSVTQRQKMLLTALQRLIAEGIATGEFAPVDCRAAAMLLEDATALFLHPFMTPTAVGRRAEARARNVIRHLLAGFANAQSGKTKRRAR